MSSQAEPSGIVDCPYKVYGCNRTVRLRGLNSHMRSCIFAPSATDGLADNAPEGENFASMHIPDEIQHQIDFEGFPTSFIGNSDVAVQLASANNEDHSNDQFLLSPRIETAPDIGVQPSVLQEDILPPSNTSASESESLDVSHLERKSFDIKVVHHPSTNITDKVLRFDDYVGFETKDSHQYPIDENPWRPFETEHDFALAELMLDCHMNKRQSTALIKLVHSIIANPASFTIQDFDHLDKVWTNARKTRSEQFEKKTISVEYKQEVLQYDVYFRPLWTWCQDLLRNADLIHQFRWNPQQIFVWNEGKFERLLDEPWTAENWWNYQSRIPIDGKLFGIILYADKTRLSSFGTEKGYPVVARCANLPVDIRNSDGLGGGRLVGWLPIPAEDAQESGTKHFIRLKRDIWHRAVYEIVKSIEMIAKTGYSMICGDGIERRVFPWISMLSADYEEQTMMALTRGGNALVPCPVCLVKAKDLTLLSTPNELRTTGAMREIWERSNNTGVTQTEKEEILKQYGLRDVKNVFWSMQGIDVYSALSWDRLHAYHGGLFSDHILNEFKLIMAEMGPDRRDASSEIDDCLDAMPRWPDLAHISSLKPTGEYSDGSKFEDLSKVLLFAAIDVFTAEASPRGYSLLKLLRSYMELDMYASLTVHTSSTLIAGREELSRFETALHEYARVYPQKSWAFPKIHTHQHMFDDILNKGATRNYNTKPGEKMNGPLKKYYQRHTNFKDVAKQILRVSEMDLAAVAIRSDITRRDDQIAQLKDASNETDPEDSPPDNSQDFQRVRLGSRQFPIKISLLQQLNENDRAFNQLQKKIEHCLAVTLKIRQVILDPSLEVTPYRSVKIYYASVVDWRWNPNILRANPNFHGRPRYDFCLVQNEQDSSQFFMGQILYLFRLNFDSKNYDLALILPFDDRPILRHRTRDLDLRVKRLHSRRRDRSVVINVEQIVRGVMLARDPASQTLSPEFLVVDMIDEDMWLRLKSIQLASHVRM